MMNQQANMAAMNAGAGGPVGGNAMNRPAQPTDYHKVLNTYIYDYFLRNNHLEMARAVKNNLPISLKTGDGSPHNRGVNGVDPDTKDHDTKEEFPQAAIAAAEADNSFLLDWFSQFWDVYKASQQQGGKGPAAMYVNQTRENAQQRNLAQQQKMAIQQAGGPQAFMMRQQPGMMARRAQMNAVNGGPNPAQMQQMQMKGNAMQRDGSGMNMGDQRPNSPGNGENAPSPNKRPRLDGSNGFNGQMGPAGRGQPMQGQPMGATSGPGPNQMMMANGMTPEAMQQAQLASFQGQNPNGPRPMEGMNPNGQQGSPMSAQMDSSGELFAGNAGQNRGPGAPNAGGVATAGNHALQDYQMQLMLLEQQNKKRLLMARQEQDNMPQPQHGPGAGGQPGFGAQAMSPQGSRTGGPSPSPADQMKRTPKLPQSGLPGSPMPDGAMQGNRSSPMPNNGFDHGQLPAGMPPQFYQAGPGGPMGPNGMRPPSSHPGAPGFNNGQPVTQQQMEAMRQRGGQPMPNGMWPQGGQPPMMGQGPGQPPQQIGTPQQGNRAMPPPPAPANDQQRTQPASPQLNQTTAPPTPQTAAKANPKKGKADAKDKAGKNNKNNKKNSTAATGATTASDADPPPTPTPSTPITPHPPQSFNMQQAQKNGVQQANQQNAQQNAQQTAGAPAPAQMDPNVGAPFGPLDGTDGTDLMNYSLDGPDVLENFDFDSFLHTGNDEGFPAFDANFDFTNSGVEAGDLAG